MAGEDTREIQDIILTGTASGLGLKITGGFIDDHGQRFGIFVRKIIHGGTVAQVGQIKVGDEIFEINGQDVTTQSNSSVVDLLRRASSKNSVEISYASDKIARTRFSKLISLKRKKYMLEKFVTEDSNQEIQPNQHDVVRKICLIKNASGIGIEVESITFENRLSESGKTLLQIHRIVQDSAVDEDGRLECGDYIVSFNGVDVIGWKPEQLHSVFLREKLRSDPSVDIEYIPHNTPQDQIEEKVVSKLEECHQSGAKFSPGSEKIQLQNQTEDSEALMELRMISPIPEMRTDAAQLPPKRQVLKSCINRRKLTLEDGAQVKVHKLQSALEYLGIVEPNENDMKKLTELLKKDENDMVCYGEFVEATKKVFHSQLRDLNRAVQNYAGPEYLENLRKNHSAPSKQDKAVATDEIESYQVKFDRLEDENTKLQKEIETLRNGKDKLHESLSSYLQMLENSRQENNNLRQENNELHSEHEKTVKDLKRENDELRKISGAKSSPTNCSEDFDEMRTRASLGDCEYRKITEIRKSQEEAIRYLLHFATKASSTELYVPDTNALSELNILIEEAREAVITVKPLLDNEELPFGWEEATLPDGSKYFINHADRSTSWTAPRNESELPDNSNETQMHEKETLHGRGSFYQSRDGPVYTVACVPSDSDTQDDL